MHEVDSIVDITQMLDKEALNAQVDASVQVLVELINARHADEAPRHHKDGKTMAAPTAADIVPLIARTAELVEDVATQGRKPDVTKAELAHILLNRLAKEYENDESAQQVIAYMQNQASEGIATLVAWSKGETNVNQKSREDAAQATRAAVTLCEVMCRVFTARQRRPRTQS